MTAVHALAVAAVSATVSRRGRGEAGAWRRYVFKMVTSRSCRRSIIFMKFG